MNRQREILDLLFNADQTGKLIDECTHIVAAPRSRLTIAEADRRHWDWHPILSSQWTMQSKSTPGAFYRASPSGDFWGMAQLMKSYMRRRRSFIDKQLLGAEGTPYTPVLRKPGKIAPANGEYGFELEGPADAQIHYQWRLAETTAVLESDDKPTNPGAMEIAPLWSGTGDTKCRIPAKLIQPLRLYRVRARAVDADGVASHWSAPVEIRLP
jgi:hypothetical protein